MGIWEISGLGPDGGFGAKGWWQGFIHYGKEILGGGNSKALRKNRKMSGKPRLKSLS